MSTSISGSSLSDLEAAANTSKAEAEAAEAILRLNDRKAVIEHREYLLDQDLDHISVRKLIDQLDRWVNSDPTRPIRILINCGGDFIQSLALHDYLNWIRQRGVRVIIQVSGRCEGQVPLVLRAADEVYMSERAYIVLSEVTAAVRGNTHEGDSARAWLRLRQEQQYSLLCTAKLTREKLRSETHFKNWLIDAKEAEKLGLAKPAITMPNSLVVPPRSGLESKLPSGTAEKDRKLRADCLLALAKSELAELELRDLQADPARHGMVRFMDRVDRETAAAAKRDLVRALRLSSGDITVLIDSPGGTIVDGLSFIDLCLQVRNSGRVINTEAIGYAASMGGAMLQLGATRTMGRNAWLLVHRASNLWRGTTSEFEHALDSTESQQRYVLELLAARSKFTPEEILERCRTHDWWISASDALKFGFIDLIR